VGAENLHVQRAHNENVPGSCDKTVDFLGFENVESIFKECGGLLFTVYYKIVDLDVLEHVSRTAHVVGVGVSNNEIFKLINTLLL
jgi:hypothetical protein